MFAKGVSWSPLHTGSAQAFPPGEGVVNPCPGDFILTHGTSWSSRLIRFGEKIRYWGPDKKFTRWNHAAIFINTRGDIIEALGSGVQQRNISVYEQTEYQVIHLENVLDLNREQEVRFAQACLNDHYGWLTILSIAFCLLTGSKLGFGVDGQEICSALVARCLERTGEIFPTDPWHIMPADLAKFFNVEPGDPNATIGTVPDAGTGIQFRST
jgi:hypothetical protein